MSTEQSQTMGRTGRARGAAAARHRVHGAVIRCRHRAVTTLVLAALLVVAACGGGGGSSQGAQSSVLRVSLNGQPTTLDPVVGPRPGQAVWGTVLEPLVTTDLDTLEPTKDGLVTDWERTDDTTWTFTVREGVTFTNGEAADAAAVANTLTLVRDTPSSLLKAFWANAESIEATDATTVVVKTKTPEFSLVHQLGTVFLVPPKYYDEQGGEGFSAKPIGTGPFTFESQRAGRDITVVRNDEYWGRAAEPEKIVFSWSDEASQRLSLLRSGGTDVALDLPPSQAEEASRAGLNVVETESTMKVVSFLESNKAPLDDPDLREAVALAIDRDKLVTGIWGDKAVAETGMTNVVPGTEPAESVATDLARAKQLVGDKKVTLPLTYPTGHYTNIKEVAQAVGGQLEEAGFTVDYKPVDYSTLVKQLVGRELNGVYIFGITPYAGVPDFFASGWMKSTSISGNCADTRIDALAARALEQKDAAASEPVYDELNTLAVVKDHCFVPLYRPRYVYATGKKVGGIVYGTLNTFDFSRASVG